LIEGATASQINFIGSQDVHDFKELRKKARIALRTAIGSEDLKIAHEIFEAGRSSGRS
jgi:hypothetical protein